MFIVFETKSRAKVLDGALHQYRDGRRNFSVRGLGLNWISTAAQSLIRLGICDARRGRGIASAAEQALAVDDDTAFAVLKSRRGKK
ncbi:MAG: hypothetical protein U0269_02075 [Polyangiales bacterium]